MFERIARLRAVIGARIVKFGVQVAGFDAGKLASLPDEEPDDDESDFPITTFQTVELNDRAKEMVREGLNAQSPIRMGRPLAPAEPLAGSAAARIAEERRKREDALRPKR